jgi:uncharacterized protein (TIGR00255 family)
MTGYGRAAATVKGHSVAVELRSVNHRFLELKVRGSSLPPGLEDQLSARIRASFERGSIAVTVAVRSPEAGALRVDRGRAHQLFRDLSALAAELGVAGPGLAEVLAQPGALTGEPSAEVVDDATALGLLDQAIAETQAMRRLEGAALTRDISARVARLTALAEELSAQASQGAAVIADRLHDRIVRLMAQLEPEASLDPARLAQEVAMMADRADITEELVRLRSHLEQCAGLLDQPAAVGRRFEFLLQEIGRELNTIGAKSWSAAISTRVVEAKSDLEKLREQAQNVE